MSVRRLLAGFIAAIFAIGLVAPTVAPAYAAADDATFDLSKEVTGANTSPYDPGEAFSYTITLNCRSTLVDTCTDADLSDTLPAPLVFNPTVNPPVTVLASSPTDTSTLTFPAADEFAVDFTTVGADGTGLPSGHSVTVTVFVQVPTDLSADYNGVDVVNTAIATGSNALPVEASDTVRVEVEERLDSTVQKTVDDHQEPPAPGVPALPNQPVDYTIGGGNASNRSVDAIVVQDPADGVDSPFEGYLDFTGITSITPPTGADQVAIETRDASGVWTIAYGPAAIPTDFTGIPDVDPPSDVKGLRFVFTSSTGQLPPTPVDGQATIGISAVTNDLVTDETLIPVGGQVTVPNTASSNVVVDDRSSAPKTADGGVVISNTGPFVDVEKGFADPALLAGEQTTALISATNGYRPVTEMVIAEPSPGSPDLADQGLDFDGFTDAVVWPPNATSATITYVYGNGDTETLTTDAVDTLPESSSNDVIGFTVTFTGPILPNAQASLPFTVTAQPIDGADDVVTSNETTATVTDELGKSGTDQAAADLTRHPGRVSTVIEKNIARDWLWAVPGTSTEVSFNAKVNDEGANASTIGSEYLIISDPVDPQPGDDPDAFWNTFDLEHIVAGVPDGTSLEVQYWDGETWQTLPGGTATGPTTLTLSIPDSLAADIEGIRFIYTPPAGELLPPGFQVAPTITVDTRDEFRTGGSVAEAAKAADPLNVPNTAGSAVANDADASPDDNTNESSDAIELDPTDGSGPGPDVIEKHWLVDPADPLFAFSGDERVARVSWSSEGLPLDSVTITDDPTAGASYDDAAIRSSVFDTWNLVEIEPIDAVLDPQLQYDAITSVELFEFDEASGTGGWVDVTAAACGADGSACIGQFPGYVLDTSEQASTRAVRLGYGGGSRDGVEPSYGHDRNLDLRFELRDATRSDGAAVTGTLHEQAYNLTGQPGVVNNTARLVGTGAYDVDQQDADAITILDSTVNVTVSKSFDQDSLPVPPLTTDQALFPLVTATITARNRSESSVATLEVSDPAPLPTTPSDSYLYLNLYDIESISVPEGATESTVTLTREGGVDDAPISIADALALVPTDLDDVIGITVLHRSADGVDIVTAASSTLVLDFQLRKFVRGAPATPVGTDDFTTNVAGAAVTRPGDNPDLDEADAEGPDELVFVEADYSVVADKSIDPATRTEADPSTGYTVTLSGQPAGNVRTTVLTIEDDAPTFWNAFEFAAFPSQQLPPNLHQLRVSALTGVDFEYDAVGNVLSYSCGGSTDLTACWTTGEWQDTAAGGAIDPALPAGIDAAAVRGLRFEVRADADESNWEQSANPIVTIAFSADRLEFLHLARDGQIDAVPVPSTQPGLSVAPGEDAQGTTSDTVEVHGLGAWLNGSTLWADDEAAAAATELTHLQNAISVVKTPGNGSGGSTSQQFPPSSLIPYAMTVTNTGQWPITGLTLEDQVATDGTGAMLAPVPGVDPTFGFTLTSGSGEMLDASGFSGVLDPVSGLVTIDVPDGFVFNPGDVLVISAALQFRTGLAPDTPVDNTITASSDRLFDRCQWSEYGTSALHDNGGDPVADCASFTTVRPTAAAPISIAKYVKGAGAGVPGVAVGDPNYDDLGVLASGDATSAACEQPNAQFGFYRNRCVPITRPGGVETWMLAFNNLGNVPARVVAGIDVLPAVGDTGVTVTSPRGSQWSPTFLGHVALPGGATGATITMYYTTTTPSVACNATDIQYSTLSTPLPPGDPCFADIAARGWTEFTAADDDSAALAQAKALKAVVEWPEGSGLQPGGGGVMTFQTRTPYVLPDVATGGLPIAWNAVAAGSRGDYLDAEIYRGPVEPVRSGVATPTGEIALTKQVVTPPGWSAPLPDSYDADVQCFSGDPTTPIELVDAGGASPLPAVIPADGTQLLFGSGTNLPMYADCTVQELDSQGSLVSYDPTGVDGRSGQVQAHRDLAGQPNIAHPAPDEIELQQVTVTNEYRLGGFTVTKEVDDPGALDQAGEPIAFDPAYDFTASCSFLGEEVIPAGDREFSLHEGEVATFDDLPVGADCTVTETGTADAAGTKIVVTENGVDQPESSGTSTDFTVLADTGGTAGTHATAVTVTNAYTVGGIDIEKTVTGSGADIWAPDEFEVRLSCTWDQASSNPVFDETRAITDGETWSVDHLPTGAVCDITEPDDGGATQSSVTPDEVTIGAAGASGDPVQVEIVNDFRVGGFVIEKTVDGPGAGFSEGVDFTFSYVCTLDGVPVDPARGGAGELTITGDGTTGPLSSEPVENLPVNALCTIEETDAGGADALPEPVTITVLDEGPLGPVVGTVSFTNHYSAGTVAVTKVVAGEASTAPEYADLIADATYTVHVTCAVSATADPVYEGDVEVTGGDTVTVVDPVSGDPVLLPLGTHCWGTESDDAGATGSSVDHDSFETGVVVVADDGDSPQPLELTATNTFDLADLVVEKALAGDAAGYAEGTTFEILVTCTLDRGAGNDPIVSYDRFPVELAGGEQQTLSDIPIGSDCYAEEPDGQGAWSIDISATEAEPVVIGDGAQVTITVTNVFPDAGFVVSKTVDNGGAEDASGQPIAYESSYDFTASCTFEGSTVLDTDFALRDGQARSFTGLPAGADCTVDETEANGAETTIILTQSGNAGDPLVGNAIDFALLPDVDDLAVTTVAVTNHYTVGSVEVVKAVTGTGADAWGGTFGDFEVQLVCTLEAADPDVVYSATHTLTKEAPGDVWLVENLPTGADCTVTETDDGGATESTVTPGSIVVGDDTQADPVRVDVENEFRTGGLDVLKQLTGPGTPEFSNGPFEFHVVCTYEGATVVDQTLVVEGDGGEGPLRSETITGIPVDAECVVTETDDGGADATPAPVTITIADQSEAGVETVVTAGFVNAFSLGEVQLTKEVDGEASDAEWVSDAVFTVQVTCQLEVDETLVTLYDGPVGIGAGETVPIVDAEGEPVHLPLGTHCFAEETDAATASEVSIDHDSYENAAVITVADEPQLLTLTVTNTFELGSIELRKTVSGATDQANGKVFTVAVTCVLDRGDGNPPYTALDAVAVKITAGEAKTIDGLPVGADCWAVETDAGGAVAVTVSATEAKPVVVGADEVVRITVDNRFDPPMPATGVDGAAMAWWLGGALLLVGAGALALVIVLVRRRRSE